MERSGPTEPSARGSRRRRRSTTSCHRVHPCSSAPHPISSRMARLSVEVTHPKTSRPPPQDDGAMPTVNARSIRSGVTGIACDFLTRYGQRSARVNCRGEGGGSASSHAHRRALAHGPPVVITTPGKPMAVMSLRAVSRRGDPAAGASTDWLHRASSTALRRILDRRRIRIDGFPDPLRDRVVRPCGPTAIDADGIERARTRSNATSERDPAAKARARHAFDCTRAHP